MVDRGTHHQNEKLKALRRLYQRTENNKGLRENNNKNGYYEGKTFQTIENIKREKYWNLKPYAKPWKAVYKLESNKRNRSYTMTTLQNTEAKSRLI